MAFYRSELQVPVNKTSSEIRSNIEIKDNLKKFTSSNSSILDNWCEKVKLNLNKEKEKDLFSSIQDDLINEDISGQSFLKSKNKESDLFCALNMFQQLQSKIAIGSDGNMHFTAKFDVKDVDPDSVKVFVKEGSLIITVESEEIHGPKISTSREYTKKFNLPPLIILDSITCSLSSDNILCLDGVLETSFSTKSSCNLNTSVPSIYKSQALSSNDFNVPFQPKEKYRLNINIGIGYEPNDITLNTRDDKLFIKARHEEKSETRTNYREFSKEVTLPEKVDAMSLSAIYNSGILYIEAPFID